MPGLDELSRWMARYRQAWNSNDPDHIGQLFAEQALYYTEPFSEPWRGRVTIVERWLARRDESEQTQFEWHPLSLTDELAVVQGKTTYTTPPATYSNLWLIRLDQTGSCTEFVEWWMQHPVG